MGHQSYHEEHLPKTATVLLDNPTWTYKSSNMERKTTKAVFTVAEQN